MSLQGWHFAAVKSRARSRVLKARVPRRAFAWRSLLGWLLAVLSIAQLGQVAVKVVRAPGPTTLESTGAREVVPADFASINRVLARRGPGLGLTLRRQLAVAISEEATRAGYDPLLILAIIDVESDFSDEAVSVVGAKGLMQIRPTTLYFVAQKEGLKLSNDEVARDTALQVRLGIRYLRSMHELFGSLDFALMAYNAGPNRLREAAQQHELEQYRGYVRAVRTEYTNLRRSEGLGSGWAMAVRAPHSR